MTTNLNSRPTRIVGLVVCEEDDVGGLYVYNNGHMFLWSEGRHGLLNIAGARAYYPCFDDLELQAEMLRFADETADEMMAEFWARPEDQRQKTIVKSWRDLDDKIKNALLGAFSYTDAYVWENYFAPEEKEENDELI